MPYPLLGGRPILEIDVPQKTVCQNECERCGRTWYEDEEKPTPKAIVRLLDIDGKVVVDASYDVLCEGCVQTVTNLLKSLARDMKKLGPAKGKAKKEEADASSEPDGPESTSPVVPSPSLQAGPPRQPPSGPSRPQ